MQISNLVKPLDQMSDDELIERLRQVRHNREVVRPAAKKIVAKAEKKESNKKMKGLTSLLDGLSEEQRLELIKQLENGSE